MFMLFYKDAHLKPKQKKGSKSATIISYFELYNYFNYIYIYTYLCELLDTIINVFFKYLCN